MARTLSQATYVCHCKQVTYTAVEASIDAGATSIADLQRTTTACTRCFGCRHELERILELRLGEGFRRQSWISLPEGMGKGTLPRPMYMPILAGLGGHQISTRVIVFNLEGPTEPAKFRLDILRPDGERVRASDHEVARGHSAVIELPDYEMKPLLPDGFGTAKLVLNVQEVGSLRPYFHLVSPTCITSTHEKTGAPKPNVGKGRSYHWIFPIGASPSGEEAYFFCTNTQVDPIADHRFVWQDDSGGVAVTAMPRLEFDQTACVPLHENFPSLREGSAIGAVRLEPATHVVAGFMLRHDPRRQLWRVQHL
jgi:bacterioferritin-associated ferredoxin